MLGVTGCLVLEETPDGNVETTYGTPRVSCRGLGVQSRWDHEGCFDLLVVGQGEKSNKPILVPGDSLAIHGEGALFSEARRR